MSVSSIVFNRKAPLSSEAQLFRQVLLQVEPESCPGVYNFHMHTIHSDGQLQPSQVMQQALEIGLRGLAITDHHSIKGYLAAQEWLQNWRWRSPTGSGAACLGPKLWLGMEINADLLGTEVHLLAYEFDSEHVAMRPYLQGRSPRGSEYQAGSVVNAVQEAGGLVVLAHPVRYRRDPETLIGAAAQLGIDGVETYYAYNNPDPWQPTLPQTETVYRLAQHYGLLSSCGTDTHGTSLLRRI